MGKLYLFNVYTFCKSLYVINVGSPYGLHGVPIYFLFIWSNVVCFVLWVKLTSYSPGLNATNWKCNDLWSHVYNVALMSVISLTSNNDVYNVALMSVISLTSNSHVYNVALMTVISLTSNSHLYNVQLMTAHQSN